MPQLTDPPHSKMWTSLESMECDMSWLINRILNYSLPSVPYQHQPNGGLLIDLGIDLGCCSTELYYNCLQMRLTSNQDRILSRYVGLRGEQITLIPFIETNYFDGTSESFMVINEMEKKLILRHILNYYSRHILRLFGKENISNLSEDLRLILLSLVYDYGLRNRRKLMMIWDVFQSNDLCKVSAYLRKEELASSSVFWSNNRKSEILYLLNNRLELFESIDSATPSTSQSVLNLESRLAELGFTPPYLTTLRLKRFSQYIEMETDSIDPGDTVHIWLASNDAPKNVLLVSGVSSLSIEPTNHMVSNWLSETLDGSGHRLHKANRSLSVAHEFEFDTKITVAEVSENGMGVQIRLPSITSGQYVQSTQDPNYDQSAMAMIVESLLSDKRVYSGEQLLLNDSALAAQGLCTLIEERRQDPQNNNDPKFREEFVDDNDWSGAVRCPDLLHLIIYPDEISDIPVVESQEEPMLSSDPQSVENDLLITSVDTMTEAEQFDYYMNAIRQFHPNVSDPVANTVELLGIAGWLNGRVVENTRNQYNDTILQLWVDGTAKKVKAFKATTAPGKFKSLYNINGDAHLVKCSIGTTDGRYKYKIGTHSGYVALNQAEDFKVWRDPYKTGIQKPTSLIENGRFGINMHTSDRGNDVQNWSAGCQVVWGGTSGPEWIEFIGRLDGASSVHSDSNAIYYTLINSQDLQPPPNLQTTGGGS